MRRVAFSFLKGVDVAAYTAIDLHQKVREVLQHTSVLLPEADRPIHHFERSANTGLLLLKYMDDHIDPNDVYRAVYDRHFGHLRRMVLAELTESFERFLKELASVCVDYLCSLYDRRSLR